MPDHECEIHLAAPDLDEPDGEALRLASEIYRGKLRPGDIDIPSTTRVANHLLGAVKKGYGNINPGYNTPDFEMISRLKKDVWHFSAAKNHAELKEMSAQLVDSKKRIKSFVQFREDTAKIHKRHNGAWLKTEYDTAVASSNSAARWVEYEKDGLDLTYSAVMDKRTRPSHAAINGVTKPIAHRFWDTHYPPIGFLCRCGANQSVSGRITPDDKINYPDDIPPMFRTNLAKTGNVFPPGHAYYNGLPDKVRKQATKLYNKTQFDALPEKNYIKDAGKYKGVGFDNESGGYIAIHKKHHKGMREAHLKLVRPLRKKGEGIELISDVDASGATGDALRNGSLWEFKSIAKAKNISNSIQNRVKKSQGQSPRVLLSISCNYRNTGIIDGIYNAFRRYAYTEEIELMISNKLVKITRKQYGDGSYEDLLMMFLKSLKTGKP